jgi:Nucleotidyl transferase AbiEii toxin, Type IV TA system
MRTFKPHFEILPSAQQVLWPSLKPTASLGFALYGGTAVALQLGHRTSVDFDFFTHLPLDRAALYAALPFLSEAQVLQEEPNALSLTLSVEGQGAVKLSFFGTIGFGRVGAPLQTEDGVLQVGSLEDLMGTKLKTILQRAQAKDYQDIAAMIESKVSISQGLATAQLFFGRTFQPSESLKAMTYFGDGDLHTLTTKERGLLIDAAKKVRDLPVATLLSDKLIFG